MFHRRGPISLLFVVIALCATTGLAQQPREHKSLVPEHGTHITGAIDIIMDGKPELKSATEILAIAQKVRFNDAGAYESKHDGGSIQYVPPEPIPNALQRALSEGLLLYKLTVRGTPPKGSKLTVGTYYFYMQYLYGRWVGFAVNQTGVACVTFGLIARQVFTAHPAGDHIKGSYIIGHPIAEASEIARVGLQAANSDWADVQINWVPFGAGCWKDIVCVPGPDQ